MYMYYIYSNNSSPKTKVVLYIYIYAHLYNHYIQCNQIVWIDFYLHVSVMLKFILNECSTMMLQSTILIIVIFERNIY